MGRKKVRRAGELCRRGRRRVGDGRTPNATPRVGVRSGFGRLIDYFADEYARGRTPNPCVVCNTWLKFGQLWAFAKQLGADFIATGHYAQVRPGPAGFELHKGADPEKDQSYVLHGIGREV